MMGFNPFHPLNDLNEAAPTPYQGDDLREAIDWEDAQSITALKKHGFVSANRNNTVSNWAREGNFSTLFVALWPKPKTTVSVVGSVEFSEWADADIEEWAGERPPAVQEFDFDRLADVVAEFGKMDAAMTRAMTTDQEERRKALTAIKKLRKV